MGAGRVIWITGLPGAGKTTVANMLHSMLSFNRCSAIILDGDEIRGALQNFDYSEDGRKRLAKIYSKLALIFSRQGFTVICSTVSMFHDIHAWNRSNIPKYCEVYLKVPMEVLISRNQKELYAEDPASSEIVYGEALRIEEPISPDLLIADGHLFSADVIASRIYNFIA